MTTNNQENPEEPERETERSSEGVVEAASPETVATQQAEMETEIQRLYQHMKATGMVRWFVNSSADPTTRTQTPTGAVHLMEMDFEGILYLRCGLLKCWVKASAN